MFSDAVTKVSKKRQVRRAVWRKARFSWELIASFFLIFGG